ncbi:MAG: CatB-related O-acetyltransferase, partial [Bacteroidota bacterium]|nr:CatB-related O-acetyltransferase [Bacteroidota bacterium]
MRYFILNFFYKLFVRKKYNVRFAGGVKINKTVFFGGNNYIGKNTEFFNSELGFASYIANNSVIQNTKIGKFCSIGDNVRTKLGMHPSRNFVSTHPAFFSESKITGFTFAEEQKFEEHIYIDNDKKFVAQIGHDVWIGNNVIITDGIKIGNGAIIAAGAVVAKNVDPYTVVGGVPAKKIKMRFAPEDIEYLQQLKWWDFDYKK